MMYTGTKKRYVRRQHTPRPPRPSFLSALLVTDEARWMQVGDALKKVIPSVIWREELFITSKQLWHGALHPSQVEKLLDITLSKIGTPYLDLYLVHWPLMVIPGRDEAEIVVDTSLVVRIWEAMIALRETGKVKAIGVSNCTRQHLEAIIKATGERPEVNQIDANPLLSQDDMVEYCRKQGILIIACSPLAGKSE